MSVSLDGDGWEIREALGLTWQWYVNARIPQAGNNAAEAAEVVARTPGWLPARVPGSVIDDLVRAAELPDPRVARASRAVEWVADRSWVYRRSVTVAPLAPGERAILEFDGIDPGGRVFWDGEQLGSLDGLYHSARFDVTSRLPEGSTPGEHTLAVVVSPAPASEPQVGRTDAVRVHSPRMNYGWDFSPRMRHQGIWKAVRLVVGSVLLNAVTARTEVGGEGGLVHVSAGLDAPDGAPVTVHASVWDGEEQVAHAVQTVIGGGRSELHLAVAAPKLWWPAGFGEQHRYSVRVGAGLADGAADSTWSGRVGFRTAELVQNEEAPPDALPYTAVVNGIRMPLLGWNWVPADTLYGTVSPQRLRHLVELAVRSGARLLRVWGGGLIESEAFYDACDEAGLLVWQEFSQSSSGMQSAPATDDDFVALMRREAETVIPLLRRHPSLLMWGGGNELDDGAPLDESRSPVLAQLRKTVRRLDPGRHWVATSPTGPESNNLLERIRENPDGQHDVHGPWEHQGVEAHYTLYNAGTSLAHTEFGVEGMTNARTLEALVPEADRWPTGRSNPVYRHLGEWWNNTELVQASFGGRLDTVERMRRASQYLQATGLGYAVEADRRRWPRCSMILPWQLNESFPNAWCTAVVDFRGDTKSAYDAVRRAYLKERVTIRVERAAWAGHTAATATAWVWSEPGRAAGTAVTLRALAFDGTVLAESRAELGQVTSPAQATGVSVALTDVLAHSGGAFLWEATWAEPEGAARDGGVIDRELTAATVSADLAPLLDLPAAGLEVSVTESGADAWSVLVRNVSGPAVLALRVVDERPIGSPGWAVIDGDPRPLPPGEARRFGVLWRDTDAAGHIRNGAGERLLRLEAWNAADRILGLPGEGKDTTA